MRILALALATCAAAMAGDVVTYPKISPETVAIEDLKVGETAYAALRKPPGDGPFPAIVFLHGGLGQGKPAVLRKNAVTQPTNARFLAWGYVTVTATRRPSRHDPQDRGLIDDTLAIVDAVRKLPYVDEESVVLYGGSGGGTLALEVASVSDKAAAIVAGEPATIIYMEMFTKEHIIFDEQGQPKGDRRWDVMNADPKALYTPELRRVTRRKLSGLDTPVLILHGDVHQLKGFNLGVLVPEMKALGKAVEVSVYAGEPHGFYWGVGRDPAKARAANREAEAFIGKHVRVRATALDGSLAEEVVVEPMKRANPR